MKKLSVIVRFGIFSVVILTGAFALTALAAPPASPYAPGQTLNPTCAPGDTNCTVTPPLTATTTLTTGSLLFIGNASGTVYENNQDLFWDNINNRLGIGTATPSSTLSVIGGASISGNVTTTNLTITSLGGGTQCLHVNASGVVSGTGSDCGASGGASSTSINGMTSGSFILAAAGTGLSVATSVGPTITFTISSSSYLQPTNNLSELTSTSTARTNLGFSAGNGVSISGTGSIANTGVLSTVSSSEILASAATGSGIQFTFATTSVSQFVNDAGYLTTSTGLTVANFASPNISQFTNDAGYITSLTGALLASNNLSDLVSTSSARTNIGFSAGAGLSLSGGGVFANTGVLSTVSSSEILASAATGSGIQFTFATTSVSQFVNDAKYLTTSTGLTVANFASPNISQFTNDAGYLTTSTFNATGTATYFPFWNASGNGLTATSSLFQDATGTLWADASTSYPLLVLGTSSYASPSQLFYIASSSPILSVNSNGSVDIGTTTPFGLLNLSVNGTASSSGIVFGTGGEDLYRIAAGYIGTDAAFRVGNSQIQTGGTYTDSSNNVSITLIGTKTLTGETGYETTLTGGPSTVLSGLANGTTLVTGTFSPTGGTGAYNYLTVGGTVNQTATSTGITRGFYVSSTLTSVYDYRNFETAPVTAILNGASSTYATTTYNILINPLTYSNNGTSSITLSTSSDLFLNGLPIGTASDSITNAYGAYIEGGATANTTNAYGLFVDAPTGATNNFALAVNGTSTFNGAIAIGTTTFGNGLLTLGGGTNSSTGINFGGVGEDLYLGLAGANGYIRTDQGFIVLSTGISGMGGNPGIMNAGSYSAFTNGESGTLVGAISSNINKYATTLTNSAALTMLSGINGMVTVGGGNGVTFSPIGGTAVFNNISSGEAINQTATSTGITRGFYVSSTLTSVYDYRNFETAPVTAILNGASSTYATTTYNILINPLTYSNNGTSSITLSTSSDLFLNGLPIGTASDSITNAYGLYINGGTAAHTTNAYGLFVTAPTGATNNSAAVFAGIPAQTSTASLVLLGSNLIQGGNASGTFLGANPSATFNSDFINFQVASTSEFRVSATGTVFATGGFNGQCLTSGTFSADSSNGTCNNDVAEAYPTYQPTMPGDVVAIPASSTQTFDASSTVVKIGKSDGASGETILGVVSTNPGLVFDNGVTHLAGNNGALNSSTIALVALAGRVPVSVSLENGPIAAGDELAASADLPGVAVRAVGPGNVLGVALQSYNATTPSSSLVFQPSSTVPQILVFVEPHWSLGNLADAEGIASSSWAVADQSQSGTGILDQFTLYIQAALGKLGLAISNGVATLKSLVANTVTTNELCVGTTCINQQQLAQILANANNNSGGNGGGEDTAAATTTTPAPSDQPSNITTDTALGISFLSPADNTMASGSISFSIAVTLAPSTTISRVDYNVDGTTLGQGLWTNNPEYSYTWDTNGASGVPNGNHVVTAMVTDTTGATSTAEVTVKVKNDLGVASSTDSHTNASSSNATTTTTSTATSTPSIASTTPTDASSTPPVATTASSSPTFVPAPDSDASTSVTLVSSSTSS